MRSGTKITFTEEVVFKFMLTLTFILTVHVHVYVRIRAYVLVCVCVHIHRGVLVRAYVTFTKKVSNSAAKSVQQNGKMF